MARRAAALNEAAAAQAAARPDAEDHRAEDELVVRLAEEAREAEDEVRM
jgi:hypothetical protein